MKIELKGIYHSERMSEETNCFTAMLYVDGKKVANVKNQGHGGCTDIIPLNAECRDIIQKAEAFCAALPPILLGGAMGEIDMDLELYVDRLLEEYLKARDIKKFEKKMLNEMQTKILTGVKGGDRYSAWKPKTPLSLLLSYPDKLQQLVDNIRGKLKEGEVILNTNLPSSIKVN